MGTQILLFASKTNSGQKLLDRITVLIVRIKSCHRRLGRGIARPLQVPIKQIAVGVLLMLQVACSKGAPTAFESGSEIEPLSKSNVSGVVGDMVWIEPGTFIMGGSSGPPPPDVSNPPPGIPGLSPGGWRLYFSSKPKHEVTITKGYYLGKYEVTQAQWQAVMGTEIRHGSVLEEPEHPAWAMSWYAAQEFIHRLNVAAGDSLYRLPTEAEWEYACRAGTTTKWSFGTDAKRVGDYAWYTSNTEYKVRKVGRKIPNAWGLYDMHGNVAEWVQDWYSYYTSAPSVDPIFAEPASEASTGVRVANVKIKRGGDIFSGANLVSSEHRNFSPPTGRWGHVGFRLVKRAQ